MKPRIIYIDDEPRNLTVFEAALPEDWELKCYESAIEALKDIKAFNPCLIVSDQRMPQMTGVEFLEVASQLVPDAIRIVVTGQTEEQTIIELVRRAKIFDFIAKPWDTDALLSQMRKALDYYNAVEGRKQAYELLNKKNKELEERNQELLVVTNQLKESSLKEIDLRRELAAWVPAPIVWALKEGTMKFPAKRDLVGITYDIVNSSALSGKNVDGRPIKGLVMRLFLEALAKKGGIRESSSGDSVYGHFGVVESPYNPFESALLTAQEFRVGLRSLSTLHQIELECGIAITFAPQTTIQIHEINVESKNGSVLHRCFDTDSSQIDILHRMEKLVHQLPGTNIIMSQNFVERLAQLPNRIIQLGNTIVKGSTVPIELCLLPSDKTDEKSIETFKVNNSFEVSSYKKAA